MVSPDPEPLWLQAAPWSPATNGPVTGEVVYMDVQEMKDLDKYKGTLNGKIVLLGAMRPTPDITEPLFHRYTDEELKEMETYPKRDGRRGAPDYPAVDGRSSRRLTQHSHSRAEDDGRGGRGSQSLRQAAMAATAAGPASSSTTTERTSLAMRRRKRTRSRFPTP